MIDIDANDRELIIRPAELSDAAGLAELHRIGYPMDHFTSRFPPSLLADYYTALLPSQKYSLVAEVDGQMCGVVLAGLDAGKDIRRFVRRHAVDLSLTLLLNREFIADKVKKFVRTRGLRKDNAPVEIVSLLNIVMHPAVSQKGDAAHLMNAVEDTMRSDGHAEYTLSVRKSNPRAIAFYQKSGFVEIFDSGDALYLQKKLTSPEVLIACSRKRSQVSTDDERNT
jgi:ribosomal protein S18 acetylase RimI-like enzyme